LWTASVDKDGYGQIGSDFKPRTMLKAHRVAWLLGKGVVPHGKCVLHRCDNPRCVRLSHLFLGSDQDNKDDMNKKHRNVFHTRNPALKLSVAQVRAIRRRRTAGDTLQAIASLYGVTQSTVSRIATGVRRADVR